MELLYRIFGEDKNLDTLQMCNRAVIIYFIALLMIRISGRRTFGSKSAFDNTIVIILGAVLSRVVVGASPVVSTVVCSLVLVVLHRLLAWAGVYSEWVSRIVKGNDRPLYKNGKLDRHNLTRSLMNEKDLMANVRLKGNVNSLDDVEEIYMETNGEVSILRKDK